MKRTMVSLAILAVVAACMSSRADSQGVQATQRGVDVYAACKGDSVATMIRPWGVVVNAGDSIAWNLTYSGADAADSMTIGPKRGQWPFDRFPTAARQGTPGRSGPRRANVGAPGTRYPYDVVLYCGDRTVVIDPDVIIGDN